MMYCCKIEMLETESIWYKREIKAKKIHYIHQSWIELATQEIPLSLCCHPFCEISFKSSFAQSKANFL